MRMLTVVAVALALCGCPASHVFPQLVKRAPASNEPVVFHDVRVFAATSDAAVEHRDVVVDHGRIVSIAPTSTSVLAGAHLIEGDGLTLVPGFVDFHAHLTGSAAPPWHVTWPDADHNGRAWLFCGVTTAHDVGGDIGELQAIGERDARGEWLGPRLFYSGQEITKTGSYPGSMVREQFAWPVSSLAASKFGLEIDTPADAVAAVERLASRGAQHIKVAVAQVPPGSPVYDEALLRAVVEAAHARGLKVVAHIDSAEHAVLAVTCGVDALVHAVHVSGMSDEQIAALVAAKVPMSPTLVVFDRLERAEQRS